MNDECVVENRLQPKDLDSFRLTPEKIDEVIIGEDYYVFPGTTITICCLTLRNGFNVIGESASITQENFDEDVGRKVARNRARDKIWVLEGYLSKEKLWGIWGLS